MKQFFNAVGSKGWSASRKDKICRTCVCIPKDDVPDVFFALVHGNCQYSVYVKLLLVTDNSNHCLYRM